MDRQEEYNRKYAEHLIGKPSQSGSSGGTKDGEYKCNKCKKVWHPTDEDINRRAMMTYYKCCGVCRKYLYDREVYRKLCLRIEEAEREAEWA